MKVKKLKYGNIVDAYNIYEDGRIINYKRNAFVKPYIDKDGYNNISLSTIQDGKRITKRYRLCILVCTVFNGKKPGKDFTVNHIDHIKHNDHRSNLEWKTGLENYLDACKFNLNPKEFRYGRTKLTEEKLRKICSMLADGERNKDIGEKLNVHVSTITDIKTKKRWKEISDEYFYIEKT